MILVAVRSAAFNNSRESGVGLRHRSVAADARYTWDLKTRAEGGSVVFA